MEGIGQIFNNFVENGNEALFELFLSSLEEHQTFWTDPGNDLEAVFSKIALLLACANTRSRGLKILCRFLERCPKEIVQKKAQNYINMCIKICNNRSQLQFVPLAYGVLGELIRKSLTCNELNKLMVSNLPKLLEPIGPNVPESALASTLSFLEQAMQHYPGVCGSVKSRIEQFLYLLVDSTVPDVSTPLANCMLLLQQIRGGGQNRNLHKKAWEEYYLRLVDTIHDSLNKVFAHTPETFDEEENLECLKFPPMPTSRDPIQAIRLQIVRLLHLISYLDQAIVGFYPVPKPLTPHKGLNVVLRGLSVSCSAMSRNAIAENVAYGIFLPTIHFALLGVLDGLVLAIGTNLLMFADMIYDIYPKCLKATEVERFHDGRTKKSFTGLRVKTYASIQVWCNKICYGSCIETVNELILEQIFRDITPYVGEVQLKMNASGSKLSAKALKKIQRKQNAASGFNQTQSRGNPTVRYTEQEENRANEALCKAALLCMAGILQSSGVFIKPATHKLCHEKVLPLCFALLTNHKITGLYANPQVRVALVRALSALVINPHALCPPPLQYAIHIFNTLKSSDVSAEVRSAASEEARMVELLHHPWKETLRFPVDEEALRGAFADINIHPLASDASGSRSNNPLGAVTSRPEVENLQPTISEQAEQADEVLDLVESDGEINESLAVTEGSDESNAGDEIRAEDEPVGWVEHMDVDHSADSPITVPEEAKKTSASNDSYNVDEGVIQLTGEAASLVEPPIVSLLDSDEECVVDTGKNEDQKDDDDDVVELPVKEIGKHVAPVEGAGPVASPSKKLKLSKEEEGNTSDKPKSIDALVDEMVAEFVDEP